MKLRGIDFGNVFDASGVTGFDGNGYRFHRWLKLIPGFNFEGATRVRKTVTNEFRHGNCGINSDGSIKKEFGNWIAIQWFKGNALNAMGLPNLGIDAYLDLGIWEQEKRPWLLSIAPSPAADTPQKRLDEVKAMIQKIGERKNKFSAPFGIQVNISCPNSGHSSLALTAESVNTLEASSELGVPVMAKYSVASAPFGTILDLDDNPHCDAICISNTIPFGWEKIDFKKVWGSYESPLAKLGGGGLSGKALKPFVIEYIRKLRNMGFRKLINGGGGILCKQDVLDFYKAGASSIFLGSVAFLRPWRVKGIIRYANSLEWPQ